MPHWAARGLTPSPRTPNTHACAQCLRKLLLKHSGYESATEGDSFLLAFHCPEDALLFAMEAQVGWHVY